MVLLHRKRPGKNLDRNGEGMSNENLVGGLLRDSGDYYLHMTESYTDGEVLSWDSSDVRAWDAAEILSRVNPESVRKWAVETYGSDTLLDQDRRMVAAETEAFISGRTGRERSDLSMKAKNAGPVTSPEDWHNREVDAMMTALADLGIAPKWWGDTQFRQASEQLLKYKEKL